MVTVLVDSSCLHVPGWVNDIHAFRRWTEEDDFPEEGRVSWLRGEVWADMSGEQISTHVAVKTEFAAVLHRLAKERDLGLVLADGLLLSNFAADFCGKPDLTFLTNDTLLSERVRLIEGKAGGFTELQGSPDLVLEVVSDSSVHKDTVVLRQAYWEAGIREYWIVDARAEPIMFDVLKHTAKGYAATRKKGGWAKSTVFGQSFCLVLGSNALRHPSFTLETR